MAAAPRQNLFNLTTFLTKRDAWAGNLEELLLDAPRTGGHLTTAPLGDCTEAARWC